MAELQISFPGLLDSNNTTNPAYHSKHLQPLVDLFRKHTTCMPPNQPSKMLSQPLITTFGIEFEACLVYGEQTLKSILNDYGINHTAIVKGHPLALNQSFPDTQILDSNIASENCRFHYPSWTLAVPHQQSIEDGFDSAFYNRGSFCRTDPEAPEQKQRVRKLFMEHLLIVKKALATSNLSANAFGRIVTGKEVSLPNNKDPGDRLVSSSADYSSWTITNDHTLAGLLPSQLINTLPEIDSSNINNFNSHGIELITPVFQLNTTGSQNAFASIKKHLNAIRSGKICQSVPSVWAGMHVHIGVSTDGEEQERVNRTENLIKHLLYILLLHEDLITQCFPRNRSGEQVEASDSATEESVEDNFDDLTPEELDRQWAEEEEADRAEKARVAALTPEEKEVEHMAREQEAIKENERLVLAAEAKLTNDKEVRSNARYFASQHGLAYPLDPREPAEIVFGKSSKQELLESYQGLRQITTAEGEEAKSLHRGHMYNFSNLYEHLYNAPASDGKRQKPTIEFRQHESCVDAEEAEYWVRFLEALTKKAEAATEEDMTGDSVELPCSDIEEFCKWLGLDHDAVSYWTERWDRYNLERPSKEIGL